jgi:hypothetical protein
MPTANVIDVNAQDPLSRDVLEDELGNYSSKELEEHLAAQWEKDNVRACVRSWEEQEDGKFARTYHDRKKHFKALLAKSEKLNVSMSPDLAAEELERYQRIPWSTVVASDEYKRRWHELEAILGRPKTDFSKARVAKSTPDYEKRIEEFLKMSHDDRLKAVANETDRTFLGYVAQDDPERDVRTVAQTRLMKLATE